MLHWGAGRRFVRWAPSAGPAQSAANALFAAMTVQPDAIRKALYTTTIQSLMDAGLWDKIDVWWMLAAHHEQAARLNWKQPGQFTLAYAGAMSAADFAVDRGFTGRGVGADRLNTGWNPATHAVAFQQNSAHWGEVSNTDKTGTDEDFGSSGTLFILFKDLASTGRFRLNTAVSTTFTVTNSIGHLIGIRRDAVNQFTNLNGVAGSGVAAASIAVTSGATTILARSATGSTRQLALAHAGGALSDTEATALYQIALTYRQAVGAA